MQKHNAALVEVSETELALVSGGDWTVSTTGNLQATMDSCNDGAGGAAAYGDMFGMWVVTCDGGFGGGGGGVHYGDYVMSCI